MSKHKSTVSHASIYKEIGEFWDAHEISDFRDNTSEVSFEVNVDSENIYYAVDKNLSDQIQAIAQK